jgi:hypothetical protein
MKPASEYKFIDIGVEGMCVIPHLHVLCGEARRTAATRQNLFSMQLSTSDTYGIRGCSDDICRVSACRRRGLEETWTMYTTLPCRRPSDSV